MQRGIEISSAAAGESFDRDFIGQGEIIVQREGHSRVRHIFTVNGRTLGRLRWSGLRRAVYEAEGARYYINVGALEKRISITDEDGSKSFLIERSRANPNKRQLRLEMAESDNFQLKRWWDSRFRSRSAFILNKEFYASTLLVFRFDMRHRTQTTARIEVRSVMKWETRFLHRLIALIVSRIIVERRHSGSQPLRVKERAHHFASSDRVRNRKRDEGV